jgi:hypothetical protein
MPLVFAESEITAAGISYADRTGVSYQYPSRYRRGIQPGERFVYFKGRRRQDGTRAPQVYFGSGVVGRTEADPGQPDRFVCEVLDYHAFPRPVPFKDASGKYLESGADRRGYFQPGVRTISDDDFARILAAAELASETADVSEASAPANSRALADEVRLQLGPAYASPVTIRAVEEFAVSAALEELRSRFPSFVAKPQPRNNPGFDIILAESGDAPCRRGEHFYIEVKGTTRRVPAFFATEGELQFSRRNANRYRLIVVYNIQLRPPRCEIYWHEGAIANGTDFRISPVQWSCEVVSGCRSDLARESTESDSHGTSG